MASALSLVLFVVTVVLWVRSYWVWDSLIWDSPHNGGPPTAVDVIGFSSHDGMFELSTEWTASGHMPTHLGLKYFHSARPAFATALMRGFGSRRWGRAWTPGTPTLAPYGLYIFDAHNIWLPIWIAVVIFALPPAIWTLRRARRRRGLREGFCTRCGYNLAGDTSGSCPNCGPAVVGSPPADPPNS